MNKASIIVAVLVVLAIGGAAVAIQQSSSNDSGMTGMDGMNDAQMESADSNNQAEQDLTSHKEVTMDIKSFDYEKANIKIKVGTTVTWTNQDTAKHNVVSEGDSVESIAGELLAKGETFRYTFTKPGMTMYLCEPHPYMKGMINVVE